MLGLNGVGGGCAHTPDGDVNRKARDAPGDGEVAKNETPGRPGLAIRQASVRTSTAYKAETKRHPDPLIQTGILPALRDFLDILVHISAKPPASLPCTLPSLPLQAQRQPHLHETSSFYACPKLFITPLDQQDLGGSDPR